MFFFQIISIMLSAKTKKTFTAYFFRKYQISILMCVYFFSTKENFRKDWKTKYWENSRNYFLQNFCSYGFFETANLEKAKLGLGAVLREHNQNFLHNNYRKEIYNR